MESTADDFILKIIQFLQYNEFIFKISEKEYRYKNKETKAIRYFSYINY